MNAGMHCKVATGFSTVVSCSDFTGFSYCFQRKLVKPNNQSHDSKIGNHVTTWFKFKVSSKAQVSTSSCTEHKTHVRQCRDIIRIQNCENNILNRV